jgi:hypothetical protein
MLGLPQKGEGKMQGKILCATLVLLLTTVAIPAQERRPTTVQGLGSATCAEFSQMYRGDPQAAHTTYFSWAQGFMSGWNTAVLVANVTTTYQVKDLGYDIDGQRFAIREYCEKHPLEPFFRAVVSAYAQLPIIDGR